VTTTEKKKYRFPLAILSAHFALRIGPFLHRGLRPWADAAWCLLTPILCRSRSPSRLSPAITAIIAIAAIALDDSPAPALPPSPLPPHCAADSLPPNQHQRPETTNDSPLAPQPSLPSPPSPRPVTRRQAHQLFSHRRRSPRDAPRRRAVFCMTSCTRTVRLAWSFVYILWKCTVLLSSHPKKVSARQGVSPSSLVLGSRVGSYDCVHLP
jgi:hypothetical protein